MSETKSHGEFQAMTRRLYELVSAPSGKRNWESVRELYHPRATLVRTGVDDEGQAFVLAMTFDEYARNVTELLDGVEFSETEVWQEATVFGNVARLVSVYDYTYKSSGMTRHGRGANFFNLVNEGHGWKIMNIVWDNEREGLSLNASGLLDPNQ